ncbi:cytochrome c3 family protein [Rosettibacter firmus]|uniref:cytochrome c3 family protein n=1 Tax=Rosettibacter firmus TaxID=3111522 RepID=UPI00336BF35B
MKRTILDYTLKIRLPLTLFVIAITYVITYYVSRPERDGLGYSPEQPINFSHKLHAGDMAIDCQYCHIGVEKVRNALIPSTNICMNCHTIARKDRPEIIKLNKYYQEGKPIPWRRIHRVPDYAYFNHSVHVNKGIKCESCHGDVKHMEKISQVRQFTMAACLDCHRNPHENLKYLKNFKTGPENCFACHR